MFAQVQTTNSQLKAEREVSINKNALIFNNNNQYVVIIKPDNTFEVKEIKVKTITGDYAAIMSGLNENDRVVNENALLIFNAITAN